MIEFEVLREIVAPIIAFIFGTLVNRWWNRGIPLLVLQGFSTYIEESESVKYPDELKNLIDESWYFETYILEEDNILEEANITTLYHIYQTEKYWQNQLEEAIEKIDNWLKQIKEIINYLDPDITSSKNRALNETRKILYDIQINENMRKAIDLAIANNDLHIENLPDDLEENLRIVELGDKEKAELGINAFYMIEWSRKATYIGYDLAPFKFLKERFQPYVRILESLDTNALLEILTNILPIIEKQARTCKHIQDNIEPLLKNNKQWAARVRLENYGKFPIIISPVAYLSVDNSQLLVTCQLLLQEDEIESKESKISTIKGKYVLGSGKKVVFWVVTKYKRKIELQKDTRDKLLDSYNKKDVNTKLASVKLNIESIGTIGGIKSISSDEIGFVGNLIFPNNPIEEDIIGD